MYQSWVDIVLILYRSQIDRVVIQLYWQRAWVAPIRMIDSNPWMNDSNLITSSGSGLRPGNCSQLWTSTNKCPCPLGHSWTAAKIASCWMSWQGSECDERREVLSIAFLSYMLGVLCGTGQQSMVRGIALVYCMCLVFCVALPHLGFGQHHVMFHGGAVWYDILPQVG